MKLLDYAYLSEYCAKSISAIMRVYQNGAALTVSADLPLGIDPFLAYADQVLALPEHAGVFSTPLLQFFGYFDLEDGSRVVIGPSGFIADDPMRISELLFMLQVPTEQQALYTRYLRSMPTIGFDRLVWLIQFLAYAIDGRKLTSEEIMLPQYSARFQCTPAPGERMLDSVADPAIEGNADQTYAYETMLVSLVRSGEPERVADWMSRMPNTLRAGVVAHDVLRQMKNIGICVAAVTARAAIDGGLDHRAAYALSDMYIQQIELITDPIAFFDIYRTMMVEYASRVRQSKMGLTEKTPLLERCARYVSANIASSIRVEQMAQTFGMGRSYLCTCFREEAGITLTDFIRREKIGEAQRLLRHTSRSLPDIANYLAFSSQSHFQNAFKQVCGVTPGEYRRSLTPQVIRM